MTVLILDQSIEGEYTFFELATEKQEMFVNVGPVAVRVCVKNASHKAYRGMGRSFETIEDAIAGYKSAACKTMLEYVQDAIQTV